MDCNGDPKAAPAAARSDGVLLEPGVGVVARRFARRARCVNCGAVAMGKYLEVWRQQADRTWKVIRRAITSEVASRTRARAELVQA
ncbi:MAG: hypothetical protein ACXW5U_30265 [Thermoanaerobaculia bacterium]